jgi:hypothetical protein
MKQLISTRFFRTLREASQKNIDIDVRVLGSSYDKFVNRLFKDCTAENSSAYHNSLVYTHVELASLTGVSEKKCLILSWQSH